MTWLNRIRCDICGCFISYKDIDEGKAILQMITLDSHFSKEEYETICKKCRKSEEEKNGRYIIL